MEINANGHHASLLMWQLLAVQTPEEMAEWRRNVQRLQIDPLAIAVRFAVYLHDVDRDDPEEVADHERWLEHVREQYRQHQLFEEAGMMPHRPATEADLRFPPRPGDTV